MLSGQRAAALFIFAGLFAAAQAGQADARSSAAVVAGPDASILSSTVDAAKLRAHISAARRASASRKLLQASMSEADMEKLLNGIFAALEKNPGKPINVEEIAAAAKVALVNNAYRRSLMGLQDAS